MNKLGKLTLGTSSLLATVALYGINAHADVKVPTDVPTGSQKAVMTTQQPYSASLQIFKNIPSGGGESEHGTSSNLVVNGNSGKVEYGDWHAIGRRCFNHVFIPKRVGYKVDGTVNTVADVKASDADSVITVNYVKL